MGAQDEGSEPSCLEVGVVGHAMVMATGNGHKSLENHDLHKISQHQWDTFNSNLLP